MNQTPSEPETTPDEDAIDEQLIHTCYERLWDLGKELEGVYGQDRVIIGAALYVATECAAQKEPLEAAEVFKELVDNYVKQMVAAHDPLAKP